MSINETVGTVDGIPYRFFDVSRDSYPIDIEFIAQQTGEVVHRIHIDGPGVIQVPNLSGQHGPIDVVMTFRGGVTQVAKPQT